MAKLTYTCPSCLKKTEIEKEEWLEAFQQYLRTYKCGHGSLVDKVQVEKEEDKSYHSITGKKAAYDYQQRGIEFAEETNYNCLIADAMGLGKTIQALLAARQAKKLRPILILVKSATVYQWIVESKEWFAEHSMSICPILGTSMPIIPGFDIYVMSMDTLARKIGQGKQKTHFYKKLLPLGLKLVIVDESHSFKDPDSSRTKSLVSLIREGGIQHKIFLTGTPIKNRANEYFTVLNLLAPERFPSFARFQRDWLVQNEKNVYSRIAPWRIEEFQKLISKWVLRREKTEVLKDLPPLKRDKIFLDCLDPTIANSYNTQLKKLQVKIDSGELSNPTSLLGELMRLRHITALTKIEPEIERIQEFLENTEDEKIAIGIHHTDVRDAIFSRLQSLGYNPLKLSGEDTAQRKDWIKNEFNDNPARRVLVINELAGGYGLNLQNCSNCDIVERQWNACDEEQFESRFHRNGQTRTVFSTYLMVAGTIDEWFDQMVEEKRAIFGETVGDSWSFTNDTTSMKDLAEKSIANPLRAF